MNYRVYQGSKHGEQWLYCCGLCATHKRDLNNGTREWGRFHRRYFPAGASIVRIPARLFSPLSCIGTLQTSLHVLARSEELLSPECWSYTQFVLRSSDLTIRAPS